MKNYNDYLPDYILKSPTFADALTAIDIEFSELEKILDYVETNRNFSRIYEKNIKKQENDFGIVGSSFDLNKRKLALMSKKAGAQTTTAELIKKICTPWGKGVVTVEFENDNYILNIKFNGKEGVIEGNEVLKKVLKEVIPAHLNINFSYTYYSWEDYKQKTWGDVKTNIWEDLAKGAI